MEEECKKSTGIFMLHACSFIGSYIIPASDPNMLPLGTPARFSNLPLRLGFVPEPSGRRAFVWHTSLRAAFFKDRYKGCAAF